MEAIAVTAQNDPWLSLSREERIASRREIKQRLRPPMSALVDQPVVAPEPEQVVALPEPKEPWFEIVGEMDPPAPRYPAMIEIQRVVARYFGLTVTDLISECRTKKLVMPRHIGMYLCRQLTTRSHPYIGRRFGNRDHTVSLFAFRKIERLVRSEWEVAYDVAHLEIALS